MFFLSSEDDLVVEPETTLEEVKLQRDLAESEKSEQCTRCEELETQAKELKNKLQSLELEVKKLNLSKYENLKATLQLLWTALPDTNLENSGQLDQRNDALEGECWKRIGPFIREKIIRGLLWWRLT